jgi:nucleotide-binding universal stress UspA family protein
MVLLAVVFASTSALNATIYSATRASYAMGRDRLLPSSFAGISTKRKTPWVALLFTGGIVLVVSTCLNVEQVTESASIMFLFLFLLVNLCVIRVRYNMKDELDYGFLMPFFPVLPIAAIICQVVLAVSILKVGWTAWIIAASWVSVGAVIYNVYSRSRAIPTEDEIRVIEEESAPEGDEYRMMVALANPDNALSLVTNTYALCGAKNARVELLHMVPVPDQVPLSDAEQYMLDGKEAIGEVMLYLAPRFPLSSTIRYCRNVARGIVSAVRKKNVELLIMGWQGMTTSRKFRLGSTVDPVVERVPCNVVIFRNCGNQKYRRILVPVAGGPNSAFALEIAGILAAKNDGEIVVFTVAVPGVGVKFDLDQFLEENTERIALGRERVTTKAVASRKVVSAILAEIEDEAQAYDLVVMGCTREPIIRRMTGRPVPETVAGMCRKPLVMVNASGGIRSWVKRWI